MISNTSKGKHEYWFVNYHDEDKVKMSQSGAEAMKYYINSKTLFQSESYKTFPIWDGNFPS